MGKLFVKNGTPVGSEHLCKGCYWDQFMTGHRESDLLVICTNTSPNLRVPFPVYECSEFEDRHKPDWEQMKKLAIEIAPIRISKKTRGFNVADKLRPEKPEYEPAAIEEEDDEFEDVDADAEAALTQ